MTRHFALAALASLAVVAPAHAGSTYSSAFCQKNSDGSGYCYGTAAGFRSSSDASAYFNLQITSNGSPSFAAMYKNTPMLCVVPSGSAVLPTFQLLMQTNQYFDINWNAQGQCTYLVVDTGSSY